MFWTNAIIIATAVIVCGISFVLLLYDSKKKVSLKEDGGYDDPPKGIVIYSVIMIAVTIAVSVLFMIVYSENDLLQTLKRTLLLAVIWPLAYTDIKTYRIPNLFIILGLIIRVIILAFEFLMYGWQLALNVFIFDVIAAAALLLASFLCGLILKNSIGMGDMKLFAVMGLMLGMDGIWSSVFVSLLIAFIVSIVLMISKKKTRKDMIPFGPCVVIGTFISVALTGM